MSGTTPPLDTDRLAGLVFELAAQLHGERLHRLALENALVQSGVLTPDALHRASADAAVQAGGRAAVEDSVARLLRVITERADPRAPLRPAQGE